MKRNTKNKVEKNNEDEDTSIKVSPGALNELAKKAKPFESKKDCLERIIKQNCGSAELLAAADQEPEQEADD